MRTKIASLLLVLAVVATACSIDLAIGGEDPAEAAEAIIENELAEQIGLGPIAAVCESPESVEVGTTYSCDGVADSGEIDFLVEIDREDHINVQTENVILADQVAAVAEAATSTIEESAGVELAAGAVDCGDQSIIMPPSAELACTVDTGSEVVPTTITITDPTDSSFEVDLEPLEGKFDIDFSALAAELIEGELADLIGLGPITAMCDDAPSNEVGTTWECDGTVADQVATFAATIDREDHVNVVTTNVILADQVPVLAASAMQELNTSVGGSLPDEAMDCGDQSIVLSQTNEIVCGLDIGSGIYDTTITITDLNTGAFNVVVAETPRG